MRLPRFRFTVRRMMLAVAAVGTVIGVGVEGERRRVRFRELSDKHQIEGLRYLIFSYRDTEEERAHTRAWVEWAGPTVHYHAELMQKYEWAARFPWFPVSPDPPAPSIPSESEFRKTLDRLESLRVLKLFKERYRRLSTEAIRRRIAEPSRIKEAETALREILEERQEKLLSGDIQEK